MAALELALQSRRDVPNLTLHFASSARNSRGQKLGLGGSSAAAVIAAAAGLLAGKRGTRLDLHRVFRVAARAHWQMQGGRGSNGDVAAACYGGLIRYLRYPVELASPPPRPDVQSLPANGLHLALVFSGTSAKTPSMVAAVEAALSLEERADFVARSGAVTDWFCAAMRAGQDQAALSALNDAGTLLEELGERAKVAVVTPRLARIQKLGRARGLAAKVSGAGGGDGALFASFNRAELKSALAEVRRKGFETLEVALSAGVRVDAAQKGNG
jgi:phosphomevalonate kinase